MRGNALQNGYNLLIMKTNIFLFLFLFSCSTGFSQGEKYRRVIDSLEKVLKTAKPDTLKVKALSELSVNYSYLNNTKQGHYYGAQALQLAQKLKWNKGLVVSYNSIGIAYSYESDTKKERENTLMALDAALKTGDEKLIAAQYESLGVSYWADDYDIALKYFDKSLGLYKKINDLQAYNNVLLQKGGIYALKGQHYYAADCFREIIKYGEKIKDTFKIINGSNYLAGIYLKQDNTNKALEYYLKALTMLEKTNDKSIFSAFVLTDIGAIYKSQKEYGKALKAFTKSLSYIKNTLNRNAETTCYLNIASVYKAMKNEEKTGVYFAKAIEVNEANTYGWGKMDGYRQLGEAEFENKNYEGALKYHLAYLKTAQGLSLSFESALAKGNVGATYVQLAKEKHKSALAGDAISYLSEAMDTFRKLKNLSKLELYSKYLSDAYDINGQAEKAYITYKEYIVYRDSVYDKTKRDEFTNKQSEYEYSKKEALLKATQQLEISREQTIRNFSFAGIGIFFFVALGAGYGYVRKRKDNSIIEKEKKRSDDLLLNILPYEVAEELKDKGEASAKYYEQVSIIFTDFEEFTRLSENMTPSEVIAQLNYCFKAFDRIITKYNIEKIKTIGDAYMAVSGLPNPDTDHALNAVKAALEMRDFIASYNEQCKKEGKVYFGMRIGINSGDVVAGIVGIKKFAYDIWGDAVNVASRMETNGKIGKVNVSETTYDLVRNEVDAEYRGEIEVKGKGIVKMYYVEPRQKVE